MISKPVTMNIGAARISAIGMTVLFSTCGYTVDFVEAAPKANNGSTRGDLMAAKQE